MTHFERECRPVVRSAGESSASRRRLTVLVELASSDLRTGAANDPLDLADYQARLGLAFGFCGNLSSEMRSEALRRGVFIVEGRSRFLGKYSALSYALSVARWRCRLSRIRPDIVHLNYVGWAPSLAYAAYSAGIPVVGRPGPYNSKNRLHRWVDAYAANCREHAEDLMRSPVAERVVITGSLLQLGRFKTSSSLEGVPQRSHRVRFLYLGQLVERKGLDVLVEAAAMIGGDIELLLVGGDWSDVGYPAFLRKRIADLGIGHRIVCLNHRADIAPLLEDCDGLVLPSRSEARPRVVMEAMHQGKPVIATRVGGLSSLIKHEETGLLVPPDDRVSLAAALSRLAASAELRLSLGSAAASWARSELLPADSAARYEKMYRELVAKTRTTRAEY